MMQDGAILVTGAFGYIGLALLRRLADRDVIAFGHEPRNGAALERVPPRVRVVHGELSDVGALFEEGPIASVVHLAGGGGPQKCERDPAAAVASNIRGSTELASRARARGVQRLIYASTIAVYGTQRDHGRPYEESDEARPDELYGVLKEAAEHAWTQLAGGHSLRLANVYGAGGGVDMGVNGAVERFARTAGVGTPAAVFGSGEQRIDYVHVDDVCDAFVRMLDAPGRLPTVVNIGGGAPVSIREIAALAERIGAELGNAAGIERRPAPAGKTWPDRSLSIQLAARELGWRPRRRFEDGFRELAEMMRDGAQTEQGATPK